MPAWELEWRCEKCAKEFEEDLKRIEEACSDRRADEMVSEDRQKFSEGESDGPERTVESKKGGAERKAAREQAVRDVVENFRSQRGVFTGEEVEAAIKERYREARSEREVTDTNVSNSVRSMKEEVMTQLGARKCKDVFIVEQSLIEQPPQMVELLLHLMKRIEVLERDVEHRDRRLEVLSRKILQLENQTENQAQAQSPVKIHETIGVQVSTTGNDVSNLIGKPIILKRERKGWRPYRTTSGWPEKTGRKSINGVANGPNKNMQGQGGRKAQGSPKNGGAQEKTSVVKSQIQVAQGETPKNGQAKTSAQKPVERQPGVQATEVRGQAVESPGIEGGVPSYGQGQVYCNPAQQMMLQQVLWNCISMMAHAEGTTPPTEPARIPVSHGRGGRGGSRRGKGKGGGRARGRCNSVGIPEL